MQLPRIWLITMPEAAGGPVPAIAEALEGCPAGLVGVQLRAKRVGDRQLVAWGRQLRAITRLSGALLLVNGRPDVAQIVQADGVHLGEAGLPANQVRASWEGCSCIGASRHSRPGLLGALAEGADFAFLSPVFAVPEKSAPLGMAGFAEQIAGVGLPTYALGGVGSEHVADLVRAGAAGVAIRRALYEAARPRDALRRFVDELDKTAPHGE